MGDKMRKLKVLAITMALCTFAGSGFAKDKLLLDEKAYISEVQIVNGIEVKYRVYTNKVYVEKPVDKEYQAMNIYVPEAYYNEETINGYNADTAPIFMPNMVGAYMPGKAGEPKLNEHNQPGPNAILTALSRGYVVASPSLRGRTLQKGKKYTGKAPACIVDYKAAVRYVRHNHDIIPGDNEKIISNGTSAGGALSALLGATGNAEDFTPYLKALGAAPERDDIFLTSAYCPITNLDKADAAYEWSFGNLTSIEKRKNLHWAAQGEKDNQPTSVPLTEEELEKSKLLKERFPAYVNSLGLKDESGRYLHLAPANLDNFSGYVGKFLLASAQRELDQGNNLGNAPWLTVENGKATKVDLAGYAEAIKRMKGVPAFDSADLSAPENGLFGDKKIDAKHFANFDMFSYDPKLTADSKTIQMLNPMEYIIPRTGRFAPHWRIRYGSIDKNTSLAIPVILATALRNRGVDVNFEVPWGVDHSGDYDLEELFDWIDSRCKAQDLKVEKTVS